MCAFRMLLHTAAAAQLAALSCLAMPTAVARQDATALFTPHGGAGAAIRIPAGSRVARDEGGATVATPVHASGIVWAPGRAVVVTEEGVITGSLPLGQENGAGVRVNRGPKAALAITRVEHQAPREPPREAVAEWFAVAFGDATPEKLALASFSRALPPMDVPSAAPLTPVLGFYDHEPLTLAFAPLPLSRPETADQAFHRMAGISIQTSTDLERAHQCLAEAIYHEARGESERGQQAVAQVVVNRARSGRYPSDVCDVIYQNRHVRNRCQFSYACDGRPDAIRNEQAWDVASRIADDVLSGRVFLDEIGDSTHYHATYVAPRWRRGLNRTEQIGSHIFYRMPGVTINGS